MNCICVAKDVLKELFCFIGVETFGCIRHCGRGCL